MAKINAKTTGGGGIETVGDASGVLELQTAGTTRQYIDANGNVGIGTSSPSAKLHISGSSANNSNIRLTNTFTNGRSWEINPYSSGVSDEPFTIRDVTAGADRITIDSSGRVGIGTSSPTSQISVFRNSGTTPVSLFENTTTSGNVAGTLNVLASNGNNASSYHFAGLTQSVSFWYLLGNGTSTWTSDERKKKNIETTRDGYIDDLCKLRVVKYNWKIDEDGKPKELGLIAQEVEEVFPNLIQDALDSDVDGIKYKTIKGSVLPYMLLKAIQEQQAIITDLKARIEVLEAK
jgi:hypothetical protein